MIFTNNVLNWNTPIAKDKTDRNNGTVQRRGSSFWDPILGLLAPHLPTVFHGPYESAYDVCSFKGSMNSSSFLSFMTGPLQPFHERLNKWKVFHFFFGQQKIAFVDDEKCNLPNFSFFHEAKALLSGGFHKCCVSLYLSFPWMLKNEQQFKPSPCLFLKIWSDGQVTSMSSWLILIRCLFFLSNMHS